MKFGLGEPAVSYLSMKIINLLSAISNWINEK